MQQQELIPHLFRLEFSKLVAVLTKQLGFAHIELAEDIASETFLSALETWSYKGIPANPVAWLYTVAKNKVKNQVQRQQLFRNKITKELSQGQSPFIDQDLDMSQKNIEDSQLGMLFAICHPAISKEGQISLALRVLCGFGVDEIANALLSTRETINKRLYRAKETLRKANIQLELPEQEILAERLDTVLLCIYLLFSEGYYSETNKQLIREELCAEAMRLAYMLLQNETTSKPSVHALLALMCFHSSRLRARKNNSSVFITYDEQDENLWNGELIAKGVFYLKQASTGGVLSRYHLEASIAYWHTIKTDAGEKWQNILQLYNLLLQLEYSPIAALNRIYAFSKVHGKEKAIIEAGKLILEDNHYYFMLLSELYADTDLIKSKQFLEKALEHAKSITDKEVIGNKIKLLDSKIEIQHHSVH